MSEIPKQLKPYVREPGDPALKGAGRPLGARNQPPALPPIHVEEMPFKVTSLKRGVTAPDFWNMQAPRVLSYLFKRFNIYLVYAAKGIHDPLGAQVFKLLGKPLVKEIVRQAKKAENDAPATPEDGKDIKEFKKSLQGIRKSLAEDGEILEGDSTPGEYMTDDIMPPGVDDLKDEF